jgi:amidophosphoribosyltransferase
MLVEKKEECGVVGIISKNGKSVTHALYNALIALQHRGQDATGMVIQQKNGELKQIRGLGLVIDVFKEEDLKTDAEIGIGHTRYPTTGRCYECDVQPLLYDNMSVAHNGHISAYDRLRKELEDKGYKFMSKVDSEVLLYFLHKDKTDIEKAVKTSLDEVDGSYSSAGILNNSLVIFRDPHSIRPLVWGENEDYICFASESVALDINGIELKGDVGGGEMIIIDNKTKHVTKKTLNNKEPRMCMFEYVYFSRPDSIINGRSVFEARKKLGEELAKEQPVKADVVVPIPDTARTAGQSYAETLGIRYEEGFIKNRYIGRTFIMPSQEKRSEAVRLKLNLVKEVIVGKKVVLVDDSIVRGTTLKEIVGMVRAAGAKEVHLRITSPPIKAPCYYGVDMSTYNELIAHNKTIEEIRKYLGVDSLGYLSIDGLKRAINLPLCTGCLNEEYPTKYGKDKIGIKERMKNGCG